MRRFAVPAVITAVAVVLLIVLAIAISGSGANNSIQYAVQHHIYRVPPRVHTQMAELTDGSDHEDLAAFRGKLVLVNFFASWCPPCAEETPELASAQKMLAAHGGTVLGVTFHDPASQALSYLNKYKLSYPALFDANGIVAGSWGVTEPPDNYLLDRQGKIVWDTEYQLTPKFITTTLPRLIAEYA